LPLLVQKFGGTSVATAERIMAAARRAIRARQAGNQVVVVVSARGHTTDELLKLAGEINERPAGRELDMLLATGEQVSIALMSMAIQQLGAPAISLTGAQVGIVTDSTHGKARIRNISTQRIRTALADGAIVVVAGFQGIDEQWNITTLGRGGSDTTAVALAAVLKHDRAGTPPISFPVGCEIYTDVDGVYTTDPRLLPEARKLDVISFDEMLEMASAGANVMHSRSIEFAKRFDVPVMVRSAFSDVEGTWIVPEAPWMREIEVGGVAIVGDEARVSLNALPNEPGVAHRVFAALSERNIVVDMIAQTVGDDQWATIGFTVPHAELSDTLAAVSPCSHDVGHDDAVCKVSVVGAGMRGKPGVAARVFAALAREKIDVFMVTTGDIKISVLLGRDDGLRALRALHHEFRLNDRPPESEDFTRCTRGTPVWSPTADEAARTRELAARIAAMEEVHIESVALATDLGRLTVTNMPASSECCSHVFGALAAENIVASAIVLNRLNDRAELACSVARHDLDRAERAARTALADCDVRCDPDVGTLQIRGVGIRSHAGIAQTAFGALADRGLNVRSTNTSETCITLMVDGRDGPAGLAALQAAFRSDESATASTQIP
jgi:aspartate kinase